MPPRRRSRLTTRVASTRCTAALTAALTAVDQVLGPLLHVVGLLTNGYDLADVLGGKHPTADVGAPVYSPMGYRALLMAGTAFVSGCAALLQKVKAR